jgi:imidazolonepropionase
MPTTKDSALLLTNISQLLTLRGAHATRRGRELSELAIVEDAAVLCAGGKIVSVGTRKEAAKDAWLKGSGNVTEIDCRGAVVLPGFVDSHTHPAFMQPRLVDFEKRIEGATYEQIAEAGGGIRSSINGVREAKKSELTSKIVSALDQMASEGTTTVEAKSGYGLSVDSELKSLEAIRDASRQWPGTVVPTLLGAHVVPPEFKSNPDEYVRLICEEMIPQVAKKKLARFVDVFCEHNAFTLQQSELILAAAVAQGLAVRAHVWQLNPAKLNSLYHYNPASFDHLDFMDDDDIARLAQSETVATLVPGANFFLGLKQYPPARKLIEAGAAVALASDFNPGTSPTASMPFVLSLACTHMKMSPAEAIAAATINGAWSLRIADKKGSVEPGKDADLAIFGVKDYREIPYWFATDTCSGVIIGGETRLKA